jgi:Dyp-type peroxidase family
MTAAVDAHSDDIQGNILRGYTLEHAAHVFVGVADAAGGRRLLRDVADRVTTAAPWPRATRRDATLNVALTYPGLAALAPGPDVLGAFAPEFRAGMAAAAHDLGDVGPSAPDAWEAEVRDAHILLTLYARTAAARSRDAARLAAEIAGVPGLRVLYTQTTDADRDAREHFGFRDGFSQPAVEGSGRPARGEGVRERLGWRPVRLGEFILGHRDEDDVVPGVGSPILRNGTYMVWRKLAQDVDRFERWLLAASGGDPAAAERLAGQVVGRRRDGTSLMRDPLDGPGPGPIDPDNGFGYADDPRGLRCPLGAHARRANPRDALGWRTERTKRHRIIRRGMAYGPGSASWSEAGSGAGAGSGLGSRAGVVPGSGSGSGSGERGLVFVCLNASIARQFAFIQSEWLGDGGAFGLGDDRDFLLGADAPDAKMTIQGDPPRFLRPGQRFVTTRAGHYLFVPGLAALRRLAAG